MRRKIKNESKVITDTASNTKEDNLIETNETSDINPINANTSAKNKDIYNEEIKAKQPAELLFAEYPSLLTALTHLQNQVYDVLDAFYPPTDFSTKKKGAGWMEIEDLLEQKEVKNSPLLMSLINRAPYEIEIGGHGKIHKITYPHYIIEQILIEYAATLLAVLKETVITTDMLENKYPTNIDDPEISELFADTNLKLRNENK